MLAQRCSLRLSVLLAIASLLLLGGVLVTADPPQVQGPWIVSGRVVDEQGKPMPGVAVAAYTGIGTLFSAGTATTDKQGHYRMSISPSLRLDSEHWHCAAVIKVSAPGFYEKNLCRQGDLGMASDAASAPRMFQATAVLPDRPATVDFQLIPARNLSGRLLDAQGKPLAGRQLYLTGSQLPPASNYLAQTQTDREGRFEFRYVPPLPYFLTMFRPDAKDEISLLLVPSLRKDLQIEIQLTETSQQQWTVAVAFDAN